MKIGLISDLPLIQSLNYLFAGIETVLGDHEIVRRPPEYRHASNVKREEMTRELILNSDIVIGTIDEMFLRTREQMGKHVPYVWFQCANVTRSFPDMRTNHKYFKSTDLIVCSCKSELEIAGQFFNNAQLRYVPLVYDDSVFRPVDESVKPAVKNQIGLNPDDKILLYVGRMELEKNVHTILKMFGVLHNMVPNLHLVLVGTPFEQPFTEFGVYPVSVMTTLQKLYHTVGIPEEKIHFLPNLEPNDLCNLYNAADAVMNLTLLHDENFGLAQVEAMGCGTPVIGTNWGGLKDTIVEGESGCKISTVATSALGVKVDWWEGIHKTVAVLNASASERRRLREQSVKHAKERFAFAPFKSIMESVVSDALKLTAVKGEPLELSDFGRMFWEICIPLRSRLPVYKLHPQMYAMYQKMISPYTGSADANSERDDELSGQHTVCLASPVAINDDGTVAVDDLMWPFQIALPDEFREPIIGALEAMREEPVIKVERLLNVYLKREPNAMEALAWMIDSGLVLRTIAGDGSVSLRDLGMRMSTPVYTIQRVNPMTADLVVVG
ncbi:MAG TPA: glycosyltransferase [Pyrinomonadaceae bacterium]|nr:glycosyltransferase [Pyrinomonadaceae bacterium]